jgi:hypothetical protein
MVTSENFIFSNSDLFFIKESFLVDFLLLHENNNRINISIRQLEPYH